MEYELYHHGVLGMKWGVRRYQRKDGSLTSAGKKHRSQLEGKSIVKSGISKSTKSAAKSRGVAKTKAKNTTKKTEAETQPKKKTTSEMTDAEIRERINRMMLEKQYYDTQRSLAAANPKQVSRGQKFLNSMLNDVIAPAAKETGKKWLTKFMSDKLGLNDKDPVERLKKQSEKLKYTKEIEEYTKQIKDLREGKTNKSDTPEIKTWDDAVKAQTWKKNEIDAENKIKELENARKELDKAREELEKERKKRNEQGDS